MHWSKRLETLKGSEAFKNTKAHAQTLPLKKTRFRELACPCTSEPTSVSCVNTPMSSMNKVMNSLATAVRCNPYLKESVKACDCPFHAKHRNFEKMLNGKPENLLKLTLCQRIEQPDLK